MGFEELIKMSSTIGNQIKKFRLSHGWTQAQLADFVGVSKDSVRNWEHSRSEPTKAYAKKLSKIFRCDWRYILCIEGNDKGDEYEIVIPKTLADYTTDELLAEIERRLKK